MRNMSITSIALYLVVLVLFVAVSTHCVLNFLPGVSILPFAALTSPFQIWLLGLAQSFWLYVLLLFIIFHTFLTSLKSSDSERGLAGATVEMVFTRISSFFFALFARVSGSSSITMPALPTILGGLLLWVLAFAFLAFIYIFKIGDIFEASLTVRLLVISFSYT